MLRPVVAAIAVGTSLMTMLAPLGTVAAHSEIVTTTPEAGAVIDVGDQRIEATFSEELGPESRLLVLDSSGDEIAPADDGLDLDDLDHATLFSRVRLESGVYTVEWVALSAEDGDETTGTWTFAVADENGDAPNLPATVATASHDESLPWVPIMIATAVVAVAIGAGTIAFERRVGRRRA